LTLLFAFISKQKEVDDVYNWYNLNKNLVGLKMAIFQNQVKKRVIIHYSSFDPLCFPVFKFDVQFFQTVGFFYAG
jgi:hypothetical protein